MFFQDFADDDSHPTFCFKIKSNDLPKFAVKEHKKMISLDWDDLSDSNIIHQTKQTILYKDESEEGSKEIPNEHFVINFNHVLIGLKLRKFKKNMDTKFGEEDGIKELRLADFFL